MLADNVNKKTIITHIFPGTYLDRVKLFTEQYNSAIKYPQIQSTILLPLNKNNKKIKPITICLVYQL